jgi:nitroreductase
MDMDALEKLIKGRRSVRKWKDDSVPEEMLRKGIELATWAPNGGNYQGWHFTVVTNRDMIKKMADAVQTVANKIASWPEAVPYKADVERYQKNTSAFRNAPVCIAVLMSQYQSVADKILMARESIDPEARQILAFRRSAPTSVQSASAAIMTMLLVFEQMGLGTVWMAAPLQAKTEIERLLDVPPEKGLIALVALGYPDEVPKKDRKPVDQVLSFIR